MPRHRDMADTVDQLNDIAAALRRRIVADRRHAAMLEAELAAVLEKIEKLSRR